MYKEIKIKDINLADNKHSTGILLTKKSKNLIITAHGLGGNNGNYMNLKARDYIVDNNLDYDVFRFDFYNFSNNQRNFLETTIASQIGDLNSIISHFEESYTNIYLLATSYGALTAAALNSDKLTKQILVDPSFIIDIQWQNANKIKAGDYLINSDKHIPFAFNKHMQDEGLEWSAEKSQTIINNINLPTLLIQADSIHYKLAANLNYSNKHITVQHMPNADHSFTRLGVCDEMLAKAINFIEK